MVTTKGDTDLVTQLMKIFRKASSVPTPGTIQEALREEIGEKVRYADARRLQRYMRKAFEQKEEESQGKSDSKAGRRRSETTFGH